MLRSHKYARLVTLLVATLAIVVLTAQAAMAVSPHFISASAARSGDNLVVKWKEAGLGDNLRIDYEASATATREDSCVNKGGNIPEDPKKTTTVAQVKAAGTFDVKNGSVNGTLTLSPPPTTLTCPKGQTATLISLTYTNVSITDLTNGITEPIPGTF